ncbi:MAG: hypothetical protein P4L36_03565 [Holophaga sp.]|nr:hypothetical protein [Holophaga sp.]
MSLDTWQGFLASRLDGSLGIEDLALLTGLDPAALRTLLLDLVAKGAVLPEGEPAPAPDTAAAPEPAPIPEPGPIPAPIPAPAPAPAPAPESGLTQRGLFEHRLHAHPADQRAAMAQRAEEPELSAYCFDPKPEVIQGVFQNGRAGLVHARLVAAHHRSAAGLETVAANAAFAADGGVRRALLQNPVLPLSLFRRLWGGRRLQELYLVADSHEVPEQTRAMAREALRAGFNQRTAEEKAELILKSEGRCLPMLGGMTVDGHTTQLLCRHSYSSTLLIQNIARWNAAPPQLLAYLLRQELVRRNAHLRIMLERHPNARS